MKLFIASLLFASAAFAQPITSGLTVKGAFNATTTTISVPQQTGTNAARPTTGCLPGQKYGQTDGTVGTYENWATGTCSWALVAGSGGSLAIQSGGSAVGTEATLNFIGGTGIIWAISDVGVVINAEPAIDTAVVPTIDYIQSGVPWYCASASGSGTTYTCAMSHTLTGYTTGMIINWRPDVNGTGGATTLNVDTLGTCPIKMADGTTNPSSSDIVAGHMLPLFRDGTNCRIIANGSGGGGGDVYLAVNNAWGDGVTQTFNPNGSAAGINVGSHSADPSTQNNGDLWYNTSSNILTARINSNTVSIGPQNAASQTFASTATTATVNHNFGVDVTAQCFLLNSAAPDYLPMAVTNVQMNSTTTVFTFTAAAAAGKCVVR